MTQGLEVDLCRESNRQCHLLHGRLKVTPDTATCCIPHPLSLTFSMLSCRQRKACPPEGGTSRQNCCSSNPQAFMREGVRRMSEACGREDREDKRTGRTRGEGGQGDREDRGDAQKMNMRGGITMYE